ncbi:MAG: D-alanine--D-alanine ligase [Phycisphaerae bacterium]|nr:D-alanine--D-alanine ligase [Phycisphaerae bacterium]
MKKLRVAVLMLRDFVPPDTIEGLTEDELGPWKTEYDVLATLGGLGHRAHPLPVFDELSVIREGLAEMKPHVVFNLIEEFHGVGAYVPFVLGYLELKRQPYTGCNPYGLMLTHSKATAKKILKHHRIPAPDFALFPLRKVVRRPRRLPFPLIVKSATEHGSVGIAQASVVYDDKKLTDRVAFVHEELHTDAIAEQYIEGRELCVGMIGNSRLQAFPIWEVHFDGLPEDAPKIATAKMKWDRAYQKKIGLKTRAAKDLPAATAQHIYRLCKRAYRILGQSGYARMDLRLAPDGKVYLLECNPNPHLEYGEDFAESAESAGISYDDLIQRILNLGLRYEPEWKS